MTNRRCIWCTQPLMRINFTRYIALVCDNAFCPGGFRAMQGIIARNGDKPTAKPKRIPSARVFRQNYQEQYNTEAKENYRLARSLGISSVAARDFRHSSKAEIRARAKELVKA